ncbi:hypothetical protein D7Y13_39945 [Corallococcus praedator]|uniref:Uncharacterized protein n=1 Tax=Corallococcus praedator TaxID=2316724 RepID=A0ABX9Q4B0_9BACT|nr:MULTISPECIES: hypothetical protein [Corallococcus]RKH20296.1 hypothetical protein D7X75_37985 [Corallococcus sp. CA031C]RKH90325.1 hypothetical protein D7Y13_39945 [Corallococcus praedator]
MIIFGTRLYGKVDAIPGVGYVATKFGHLNFVPLLPTEGWLVVAEEGDGWRGQSIPISMKSVLVAWARTLFIIAGLPSLLIGLAIFFGEGAGKAVTPGLIAAVCIGGLIASYRWTWVTHASPERALEIARQAGIGLAGLEQLRDLYAEPKPAPVVAPAERWTPPES